MALFLVPAEHLASGIMETVQMSLQRMVVTRCLPQMRHFDNSTYCLQQNQCQSPR